MVASCPLVRFDQFIQSVRESGYRSTACAIAELIDNSIQAEARHIRIKLIAVEREQSGPGRPAIPRVVEIVVADDGVGMSPERLRASLQFGESSRFGDRSGLGRFGMGLPAASVSYSDRTEVYSWVRGDRPYWTVLDCPSFRERRLTDIPEAQPATIPAPYASLAVGQSGTIVAWKSLCGVDHDGKVEHLESDLRFELGRIFRHFISEGVVIDLNGVEIAPFDPLFLMPEAALPGDDVASLEEQLTVPVALPGRANALSSIEIRFSMLPESWQIGPTRLSNAERARRNFDKSRGVSVVRAGREIDIVPSLFRKSHWTDGWYRAEIRFGPELDELFGVTNNKQGVRIGPGTPLHDMLRKAMAPVLTKLARLSVERSRTRTTVTSLLHADLAAVGAPSAPHGDDRSGSSVDSSMSRGHRPRDAGGSQVDATQSLPPFFRQSCSAAGAEVVLDESHPFHERFAAVLRRDPAAAALIIDLLRTCRCGDLESWSRRLALALGASRRS